MAEASSVLCDLPAEQRPDLIDINMGCPVRKVVNRCAGAALLNDIPRLTEIVRRMAKASALPVTAKIRLGWDGNSRNVVEVAKALEGAGAQAVAIHARTRAEKFEGSAHWELIGEAKQAVSIPVIGNGDVRGPEDAVRMLETTGCDAVMLGRAAFGDPWVFRRVLAYWAPRAADRVRRARGRGARDAQARRLVHQGAAPQRPSARAGQPHALGRGDGGAVARLPARSRTPRARELRRGRAGRRPGRMKALRAHPAPRP